jgi:hypothetical protein
VVAEDSGSHPRAVLRRGLPSPYDGHRSEPVPELDLPCAMARLRCHSLSLAFLHIGDDVSTRVGCSLHKNRKESGAPKTRGPTVSGTRMCWRKEQ